MINKLLNKIEELKNNYNLINKNIIFHNIDNKNVNVLLEYEINEIINKIDNVIEDICELNNINEEYIEQMCEEINENNLINNIENNLINNVENNSVNYVENNLDNKIIKFENVMNNIIKKRNEENKFFRNMNKFFLPYIFLYYYVNKMI